MDGSLVLTCSGYEPKNERSTCVCGRPRSDIPGNIWRLTENLGDQANHGYYYRCRACRTFSAVNLYFPMEIYEGRAAEGYAPVVDSHIVSAARSGWIIDRIRLPDSPVFCDLGSCSGILLDYLTRRVRSAKAIGVDADARVGPLFYSSYAERIEFVNSQIDDFLAIAPALDLVTLTDVMEHLVSPDETMRLITNVLRPGGYVYIVVPNARSFFATQNVQAGFPRHEPPDAVDWSLANRSREHLWLFEPEALLQMIGKHLDIIEMSRIFETVLRNDSEYISILAQKRIEPDVPLSVQMTLSGIR